MTQPSTLQRESEDWVRTIEQEKGYSAPDPVLFRKLLSRMPGYAFFRATVRHVHPGETILEAGCGWATASFALAERGIRATAVDISEKLVADLNRLQQELGGTYVSNLKILVWDIFRLTEMQQTFDAVLSDGTYEHFFNDDDRRRILKNISTILKPNGLFLVAVPNLNNPFFKTVVDQKMPGMHPFTLKSLSRELEEGGFTMLETGYTFVNPGFEQWVRARWMIAIIRMANAVFPFLPRFLKGILAAHIFCVARKI